MPQYRRVSETVTAAQWLRFVDTSHPLLEQRNRDLVTVVPYVRSDPNAICTKCERFMSSHGWINPPLPPVDPNSASPRGDLDGLPVCPGDWIIQNKGGEVETCRPDRFLHEFIKA